MPSLRLLPKAILQVLRVSCLSPLPQSEWTSQSPRLAFKLPELIRMQPVAILRRNEYAAARLVRAKRSLSGETSLFFKQRSRGGARRWRVAVRRGELLEIGNPRQHRQIGRANSRLRKCELRDSRRGHDQVAGVIPTAASDRTTAWRCLATRPAPGDSGKRSGCHWFSFHHFALLPMGVPTPPCGVP